MFYWCLLNLPIKLAEHGLKMVINDEKVILFGKVVVGIGDTIVFHELGLCNWCGKSY